MTIRAEMEHADDRELAGWPHVFLAWSMFDPSAAVARLERVRVDPKMLDRGVDLARVQVAESLGLPHDARWRTIWLNLTEMADFFVPDEIN